MTSPALDELLSRGLTDILQLSEVISVVRRRSDIELSGDELVVATLAVIRELLERRLVVLGDVTRRAPLHVKPWAGSVASRVARVERDWKDLGRPPTLGDVCWLELTAAGREAAAHVDP